MVRADCRLSNVGLVAIKYPTEALTLRHQTPSQVDYLSGSRLLLSPLQDGPLSVLVIFLMIRFVQLHSCVPGPRFWKAIPVVKQMIRCLVNVSVESVDSLMPDKFACAIRTELRILSRYHEWQHTIPKETSSRGFERTVFHMFPNISLCLTTLQCTLCTAAGTFS